MRDEARHAFRRLLAAPIAHRGLHACGRPGGPVENSIGAALAAIDKGFGIECDIRLSRDGEAMVFHDSVLDRLTPGSGEVAARDAADLTGLALGGTGDRIPTLPDFLAAIAGRVPVVVEIKGDGDLALTRRALAILSAYDGAAAVESFDTTIVAHCLDDADRRWPVGLVGPSSPDGLFDVDLARRCDFLSWSVNHLDGLASIVPGVALTTWTVRTPAEVAMARDAGATIVFEGFVPA